MQQLTAGDCSPHRKDRSSFLYLLLSFLILAFGQPAWVGLLCPIAASIGFALFWKALEHPLLGKKRGLVSLIFFSLVQMLWLSWMTSITFQGIYFLIVYLVLSFLIAFQFSILTFLLPSKGMLRVHQMIGIAAIWVLLEFSRLYFLCGFSWNPVGMALAYYSSSLQLASVGGIYFLSFYVIFTNLLVLNFLRAEKKGIAAVVFAIAVLLPYGLGSAHLHYYRHRIQQQNPSFLSVALVQTALLPDEKVSFVHSPREALPPFDQWVRIVLEMQEEIKKVDLILLPEASVPYGTDYMIYPYQKVRDFLIEEFGEGAEEAFPPLTYPFAEKKRERGYFVSNRFWAQALCNLYEAEVVIGLDDEDREKGENYNAALHFIPNKIDGNRYEKRVLVPLGEYLPFEWCRTLAKQFGLNSFFTPGLEAKVFQGTHPFTVSICYEETFNGLVREGRKKGASFLVNLTNDGWYPDSRLPEEHFAHARVRAVENGAPLLRACNTGVTTYINSLGEVIARLDKGVGVLTCRVQIDTYPTLFLFTGNSLILLFCSIGALWFLFKDLRSKKGGLH